MKVHTFLARARGVPPPPGRFFLVREGLLKPSQVSDVNAIQSNRWERPFVSNRARDEKSVYPHDSRIVARQVRSKCRTRWLPPLRYEDEDHRWKGAQEVGTSEESGKRVVCVRPTSGKDFEDSQAMRKVGVVLALEASRLARSSMFQKTRVYGQNGYVSHSSKLPDTALTDRTDSSRTSENQ